jgi:enhancer of polycomb-like protein
LQAVISATQTGSKTANLYIPTPDTKLSNLQYESLYPKQFAQPQTYIRFSSTVEDCIGCPYCMNSDDEIFLRKLNTKRSKSLQCTEDQFEEVMNFFEQTSFTKQPFASVDNAPVLPYEEMETAFDETIEDISRRYAKDIFEHWKSQRLKHQNAPLMPTLKFERNVETDDSDPYVCFRRREVRQIRKTRGRDAQITEKLKKLRHELEQARNLMHMVKQRESLRREQLAQDRAIFIKRTEVKETKRSLGIKDDDEDLINQKVSDRFILTKPPNYFMLTICSPYPNRNPNSTQLLCKGAPLEWCQRFRSNVGMAVHRKLSFLSWPTNRNERKKRSITSSKRA